jgi:ABC-type phosphate/phosphonate transport system substrate-binding protein
MTEKTKLDYITRKKTQEDYLKKLREFFKKFNEDRKEKKRLPTLPPSFLKKSIPLPSQLKKQMDEYKKMMREDKGGRTISDKDFRKTYAKGGGVRKVRY